MWWIISGIVLLPLIVAVALFFPTPIAIRRSRVIARPRAEVFAKLRDFRSWKDWSPWLLAEPDAKVHYTGDTTAVGGKYSWDGEIVGAGEMEHGRIAEPDRLDMNLRFTRPFKSKADVHFEFKETGGGTEVIWGMDGKMPKMMVPMMTTMIGMDYKRGLHMLDVLMTTGSIPSTIEIRDIVDRPAFHWIGLERTCRIDEIDAIGPTMEGAFSELKERLANKDIAAIGPWLTFYTKWDFKSGIATFICAAPLDAPAPLADTVSGSTPAHRAFHVRHTGPYDHLGNAWSAAHTHTRARKLKCPTGGPFPYEVYTTDPDSTPDADTITDVFIPVR